MDCLTAQAAVSAALDRQPVDANELEQAKAHCRECAECSDFVRVLAALKRHNAPAAPEDLADRVIAAVRAEAAVPARVLMTGAGATGDTRVSEKPAKSGLDIRAMWRDPRGRIQLAAWSSAAAVVLIAAGFLTIAGVRQVLVPTSTRTAAESAMVAQDAASSSKSGSQPYNGPGALSGAPAPTGGAGSTAGQQTLSTTGYLLVGGRVFKYAGPIQGLDVRGFRSVGTATSGLDTQGTARSYTVLGSDDPSRVYISREESGTVLAFDRITRTYEGRPYVLTSGEIERFGAWPTLPPSIPAPTSPDGAPTFLTDGTDDTGVQVYRRSGSSAEDGIGIGPGTSTGDPAAGNPNWTWWEPLKGS